MKQEEADMQRNIQIHLDAVKAMEDKDKAQQEKFAKDNKMAEAKEAVQAVADAMAAAAQAFDDSATRQEQEKAMAIAEQFSLIVVAEKPDVMKTAPPHIQDWVRQWQEDKEAEKTLDVLRANKDRINAIRSASGSSRVTPTHPSSTSSQDDARSDSSWCIPQSSNHSDAGTERSWIKADISDSSSFMDVAEAEVHTVTDATPDNSEEESEEETDYEYDSDPEQCEYCDRPIQRWMGGPICYDCNCEN